MTGRAITGRAITARAGTARAGTAREGRRSPRREDRQPQVLSVAVAAVVVAVGALAGCSAGPETGGDASAGSSAAEMATGGRSPDEAAAGARGEAEPVESSLAPGGGSAAAAGTGTQDVGMLALPGQDVVVRGSLTVVAEDPLAAAREVAAAVARAGGYVERETSDVPTGGEQPEQAQRRSVQLVLRVPPPRFEALRAEVAGLGTELSRSLQAEDVHDEVVDTRSRLATQRASVERVRALLDRATDLSEVVTIEAELTRRQADLEALEARSAALAEQVEHATLVVDLLGPDAPLTALGAPGFLGGLERGWAALVATLTVALSVLGAALPFLVLLGLAVPPVLVARRWRRRREAATPAL